MAISGQIIHEGDHVDFSYSGDVQEFEAPLEGLYLLEVWGGGTAHGGSGGYSKGYCALEAEQKLYVVCGGQGPAGSGSAYNGGGRAHWLNNGDIGGYSGGGATHIAKVTGTLASIGKTSFVDNKNGLIVAGGGGGAAYSWVEGPVGGGSGGGLSGGSGPSGNGGNWYGSVAGGTQISGYAFGQGGDATQPPSGNGSNISDGGGGGGFYGGLGGNAVNHGTWSSGAGGSGWIDGVPHLEHDGIVYSPSTQNGGNSGNGKATITLILNVPVETITRLAVPGDYWDFYYTGSVVPYTVLTTGLYKLEAWGAQGGTITGGNGTGNGGAGGYACGYTPLKKGDIIYLAVGGTNSYNGGGGGGGNHATGGGATHIAKVTGTLASIGKTSFVDNGNGLIVAGGGGGGSTYGSAANNGGSGGGTTGGAGGSAGSGGSGGAGGTQFSGYAFGQGGERGGGGGFYGAFTGQNGGGGGGSGWIDGVPALEHEGTMYEPSMSNGSKSGNGQIRISFVVEGPINSFHYVYPGKHWDYIYSGGIQEFSVPENGLYKLEVWGGSGGYCSGPSGTGGGGNGGMSIGYKKLTKGQTIYVVVGGHGSDSSNSSGQNVRIPGGYNGGGDGWRQYSYNGSGGGGATHIAPISGLLTDENVWSSVYIVAGGGAGGAYQNSPGPSGGSGGGLSGGSNSGSHPAAGGTQTSGFAKGQGAGGYAGSNGFAGGGGGYWGGNSIAIDGGGAGGSGYIGGVPEVKVKGINYEPSTQNGINSSSGKATITYISKVFPEMYLGELPVDAAYLGGIPIDELRFGDLEL